MVGLAGARQTLPLAPLALALFPRAPPASLQEQSAGSTKAIRH
jgi:hypothetical protein